MEMVRSCAYENSQMKLFAHIQEKVSMRKPRFGNNCLRFLSLLAILLLIAHVEVQNSRAESKTSPPSKSTATPKGEETMKSSQLDEQMISLIQSLVNDAIELMPDSLKKKAFTESAFDSIMEGGINFDRKTFSLQFSDDQDNLGAQASYVALRTLEISGQKPSVITVPQTIFYEPFDEKLNPEKWFLAVKEDLKKSQNLNRDTYNLALRLIVGLWLMDFKKAGSKVDKKPREGVYLRNSDNRLYFYQGAS
jgi:hypothetical protein